MLLKNRDVLICLGIVLLNIVWLLFSSPVLPISIVLTLPMVFFVPGYMFTEMLTHARELDAFHRFMLSLGLSITLDILSGFLLNIFPIGLRTSSWTALLSCLTLVFTLAVVNFRKRKVYSNEAQDDRIQQQVDYSKHHGHIRPSFIRSTSVRDACIFAAAVVLAILSLLYAGRGLAEQPRPGFTQLWMIPSSHSPQTCTLNIGVRSFENATVTYYAVVTSNGIQLNAWSNLVLAPKQVWEKSITVVPTITTKNIFVQVKLYQHNKPLLVYREVHTTLLVSSGPQKTLSCGT